MAVNCSLAPSTIVGFAGAIAIDTGFAGVTVRVTEAEMLPDVVLIVVVPVVSEVTNP